MIRAAPLYLCLIAFLATPMQAQELDVPYFTTEPEVVEGMLDMAGVGQGDYLIDLGSGDGRIVIAAAHRGAVGHGVDLDPERVTEAEKNAREAGVSDRIFFLEENLFDTDFSQATVVTMFLLSAVNLQLRPELLVRLRPGSRVISHTFDMGDWEPDAYQVIGIRPVYLWIIPAQLEGRWEWKADGEHYAMSVRQQYQKIEATLHTGRRSITMDEAVLRGDRISLLFHDEKTGKRYVCSGIIENKSITGTVQVRGNGSRHIEIWNAQRH